MEPPARPTSQRCSTMGQSASPNTLQNYVSEGSPSPFVSNPKSMHPKSEILRPRSRSQTVSMGWEEDEETTSRRTSRLKIEMAECIETKTVTTTTTTKRAYPSLPFPNRALDLLDAKEYPLALKPTPLQLRNISYEVHVQDEEDFSISPPKIQRKTSRVDTTSAIQSRLQRKDEQEVSRSEGRRASGTLQSSERQKPLRFNKKLSLFNADGQGRLAGRSLHSRSRSPKSGKARKNHRDVEHPQDGQSETPETRTQPFGLGMPITKRNKFPETPDMSEMESSSLERNHPPNFNSEAYTPQSGLSHNHSFEDLIDAESQESFANAVATPPIAESDLELLDDSNSSFGNSALHRPVLNTAFAQNASLPSPGLSPTFAAAELHEDEYIKSAAIDGDSTAATSPETQSGDTQETLDNDEIIRAMEQAGPPGDLTRIRVPSIMDSRSMLQTFESMPNDMKTLMMYQFLRRCPRKTLHVLADVIGPALKCDFLEQLPAELSLHVLRFLNHKDLCRAARVSKHWRNVIDTNETGWKELLDRDGFILPPGELEKAIHQGWGWQDPYGPNSGEEDLSVLPGPHADGDISLLSSTKNIEEPIRKPRSSSKRKRITGGLGSDRAKRRAFGHTDKGKSSTTGFHKSEGPLTAATSAAAAVPDPRRGLPGLRKLHLFKSLYRRHYLLKNSWMNPEVVPHHFAFPAHPAHVITCLQFDDDKIITGSDDALIHVYDTKTGALRKRLEGHEGGVWALQYQGNVLVSGSTDRSVRVWDIEKGLCTQVFHGHTSTVRCLQILMPENIGKTEKGQAIMIPEKPLIITGSRDSQLRVWRLPEQGSKRYIQTSPPLNDADCPYFVRVLGGHTHSVRAIAAHRDTLVSGSYDNTVRVWKISTGETLHRLTGHAMKVYSVVLDHKRDRCISGSMDNFVKIWSLETGACLFTLEGHTSLVGLLDLADERLVSAAADSTLRIWDPENGQCKSTLTAHTGAITCFQHDGQKVISGSDRTLKMWNIKTGECMKDLLTDLSGVWQVKFDERRCVAAVQRDNLTYLEVLDFGASRDGIPASQRGFRNLLQLDDARAPVEEVDEV
ncbi:hypothetical protein HYALB_00007179 [Hymenoscyphus albidus]|uniref:F-box domain-containing protein n=1 Tax=Hymenoscyphus albidus TaxID=595503 RepID=A0A9N9QAP8_9HELO|nr:hypothetical protein HYALB_00007179 [Hymenoscyphus albidus]